jgi:hypothetical protein
MMHKIVVRASDGIDHTDISFTIDVSEAGTSSASFFIIAIAGISLLTVVVAVIVFLFLRRRGENVSEETDENELEEQVIGSFEDDEAPQVKCDVALTPTEAHAHLGKGSAPVSYDDLYGVSPPKEEDEALDPNELKDYISRSIVELEEMELPPEE